MVTREQHVLRFTCNFAVQKSMLLIYKKVRILFALKNYEVITKKLDIIPQKSIRDEFVSMITLSFTELMSINFCGARR